MRKTTRRKPAKRSPRESKLETLFAWQLDLSLIPYVREYKFDEQGGRLWRFDFVLQPVTSKIAVEIQGGIYGRRKGGHTTAFGYTNDCEKANAALIQGWKLLRFTGDQIRSGYALSCVQKLLPALGAESYPQSY